MPFFLKQLSEKELNDVGLNFLLRLLDNKYIWRAIEFYAGKVLYLLLAYKGSFSFEVGLRIAQIVDKLSDKYPILRDIYVEYEDTSYSTILKKIPFELCLGIPFEIDHSLFQKCKNDSEQNDPLAILCMNKLLEHSSQLSLFKKLLGENMNTFIYWHPCPELKEDRYLRMF
jgi:hypothetical protein